MIYWQVWQSPLLIFGLFDVFALWLASDVSSTDLQVNYDLMTFGDSLRDGSSFGKLTGLMEHLPCQVTSVTFAITCRFIRDLS